MAAIRKGARALGLKVNWRYAFIDRGTIVAPTADAVFLDAGWRVAPGTIDQRAGEGPGRGTADLVLHHPELAYGHLMGPWLRRVRDGRALKYQAWEPVIVTHTDPDFDAVVSAFLVQRLVEDGEFPPGAEGLADYAAEVDLGRYRVDMADIGTATKAIHMAYLAIQNLEGPEGEKLEGDALFAWRLERGISLVQSSLRALVAARQQQKAPRLPPPRVAKDFHPGQPGAAAWTDDPAFTDAHDLLVADLERYRQDERPPERVTLPVDDGSGTMEVDGIVLDCPPASKLNKYWVRALGNPYFVCPYRERGALPDTDGKDPCYPEVYISIDPNWVEKGTGRRPTLQGLAAFLNDEEAQARAGENGEAAGGAIEHQWNDGREYGYTIVRAPPRGTCLPYARVKQVLRRHFWAVPLTRAELTLVYTEAGKTRDRTGETFCRPRDLSPSLEHFRLACSEQNVGSPAGVPPTGIRQVSSRIRSFPGGTCRPMIIVRAATGGREMDLEQLVNWWRSLLPGPVYLFARIQYDPSRGAAARTERLLQDLGAGGIEVLPGAGSPQEVVRFNSRTVIITSPAPTQGSGKEPDPPQKSESNLPADLDAELLVYSAFLNETIGEFSRQVTEALIGEERHPHDGLVEPGGLAKAAKTRERFLAFQARYYKFDVTHRPGSRLLFERLLGAADFRAHYGEIEDELDRLYQIEQREADLDRHASDRLIRALLFFVGLAEVVQATTGIFDMDPERRENPVFFDWTVGLVGAAIMAFALVWLAGKNWPWLRARIRRWRRSGK